MELFMNCSSTEGRPHSAAGNLNVHEQCESSEVAVCPGVTHKTANSRLTGRSDVAILF